MTMKLSDAIALGYAEIKHDYSIWLTYDKDDGACRGCAIGAALYAMGERNTKGEVREVLSRYWPWTVTGDKNGKVGGFLGDISWRFAKVMRGDMTIEQLIAWVRSIEPAEQADDVPTTDQVPVSVSVNS